MSDGSLPDIGSLFSGGADAAASGTGNIAADIGAGADATAGGVAGGVSSSADAITAGAGTATDVGNLSSALADIPGITAGGTGNAVADIGAGGAVPAATPTATAAPAVSGGGGASGAGNPLAGAGTVPNPNPTTDQPSTFSTVSKFLQDNGKWVGPATAGILGVGKQILTPPSGAQAQLTQLAQQNQFEGNQLQAEGAAGQIPAAAQAGITQALNQAIAGIRSRYAAMGQSGSSAEAADIAAAQTASAAQVYQISQQVLAEGNSMLGIAGTAYANIASEQLQADSAFQSALQDFALAAGASNAFNRNNQNGA